jgi:hypothetical protein
MTMPASPTVTQASALHTPPMTAASIDGLLERLVVRWHEVEPAHAERGMAGKVCDLHRFNFLLWHEEDIARSPEVTDARIAEEIAERPVEFELSLTNVDKPAIDFIELRGRVGQFAGQTLWLTRAATFLEKLEIFPGSTFVLGVDTFIRLADPRYYGGSRSAAEEAVARIAASARGLIVFGRVRDGVFLDPSQIEVPGPLREIAYVVSQREFRLDISSTELRAAGDDSRD